MQFCSAKESASVGGTGFLKSDSTALFGLHCLRIVSPWAYFRQPVVPICCRSQNSFWSASQFQGNMVLCIDTMTEGGGQWWCSKAVRQPAFGSGLQSSLPCMAYIQVAPLNAQHSSPLLNTSDLY